MAIENVPALRAIRNKLTVLDEARGAVPFRYNEMYTRAVPDRRLSILENASSYPERMEAATQRLLEMQTRIEQQVPEITRMYAAVQGIEDLYESGRASKDLHNIMLRELDESMDRLLENVHPAALDASEPLPTAPVRQNPSIVSESADQQDEGDEIYRKLVRSYDKSQEIMEFTDGTKLFGNRAIVVYVLLRNGFTKDVTKRALAEELWDIQHMDLTSSQKASISGSIGFVEPVLARLGVTLMRVPIRVRQGVKPHVVYRCEFQSAESKKK